MKRFFNGVLIFFQCIGMLLTILSVSIFLLGFEVRPKSYINYVELPNFASFLQAKSVKYYINNYGSAHYEIEVDKIDRNKNMASTILLVEKFDITEKRFLYYDDVDIFSFIIDDDGNVLI